MSFQIVGKNHQSRRLPSTQKQERKNNAKIIYIKMTNFGSKKRIIFLILNIFVKSISCDWKDFLKKQITQNLRPKQIATFVSETMIQTPSLRIPIIHDYPNVVLTCSFENFSTLEKLLVQWDSFTGHSFMQNSLILFYTNYPIESELFVDFLELIIAFMIRPKCLMVFFGESSEVENILKYAWRHKFLDFSVITLESDKNFAASMIHTFNPFYNKLYHENLYENTHIFPEKLQNVNGYPIRLAKLNSTNPLIIVKNKGRIIKKYAPVDRKIDLILKVMSFSVIKKLGAMSSVGKMIRYWDSNLFYFGLNNLNFEINFILPMDEESINYYAFAPVLPAGKMTTFTIVLCNMIIISIVVSTLVLVSKFFGITNDGLGIFNIIKMILGQSVVREPRKMASRIIYLIIVASYVKLISFDLYDNIVSATFESNEVPFKNYEDLDKSNFDVNVIHAHIERRLLPDPHLQNLMKRKRMIQDINTCFELLIKSKNVICIAQEKEIYRNSKFDQPVIKLVTPPLWTQEIRLYVFELGTPYGEKFGKILRRVQETSLDWMESLNRNFTKTYYVDEKLEKKFDDEIDKKQLLFVLFSGYFLAISTFFTEFIMFKFSRQSFRRHSA